VEKSGKLGPQIVDSNETNRMEKTLNQQVEGLIPSRLTLKINTLCCAACSEKR
jgi:hypothetical protein